jgi:hypothetical protein
MKSIFIILKADIPGEEAIVAVFDEQDRSNSFIERNNTIKGRYRIEEKELNPFFLSSKQQPYRVMLDPYNFKDCTAQPIDIFDEELEAFHEVVTKIGGYLHLSLYADGKEQAKAIAVAKFMTMRSDGEWNLLADMEED